MFMILGLRANRDLWYHTAIEIKYPGKENRLSCDQWEWINSHMTYTITTAHKLLECWQYHLKPGTLFTCDKAHIPAYTHATNQSSASIIKNQSVGY